MRTLRDYLELGEKLRQTDQEIIRTYICNEKLEIEYSEMIMSLVNSKLKRDDMTLRRHQALIYPMQELYRTYTVSDADLLDRAMRSYILYETVSDDIVEKLRERAPYLDSPHPYWRDCLLYLKEQGVEFKDQE